jgi:microsomal dipeptidase-like Zn-dependent dipeptidase
MLSAGGYGDARIEKILGGNLLRVLSEAWKPERADPALPSAAK